MKYLRPLPVTDMKNGIIVLVTDEEIHKDSETGIEYPHQISYIKFAERKNNKAHFTAGISEITDKMRELQKTFLDLKNKCIRVAELLNDSLRNYLLYYFLSVGVRNIIPAGEDTPPVVSNSTIV